MMVELHGGYFGRAFHRHVSLIFTCGAMTQSDALKWATAFWRNTPCSLTDLNERTE